MDLAASRPVILKCPSWSFSPAWAILDISEATCLRNNVPHTPNKISGNRVQRKEFSPGITWDTWCSRNRDVKVNVEWAKGINALHYEEPVSWDRPEQVGDSTGALWIVRCGNRLPPVGFLRIDTQAEWLKVCWASGRVTGLLYWEDRSGRISLLLTHGGVCW